MSGSPPERPADAFARAADSAPVFVGAVAAHPPLTEGQAARLAALGLLADDRVGLLAAWNQIEAMWAATVERAARLPPARLDERLDGEWSFLETVRHLVFVTDAWINDIVREVPSPYHSWGIPPDFVKNASELGLDVDARPSMAEILAVRQQRIAQVREVIARTTTVELGRKCVPRGGRFRVVGALQVVIFEEWAHNQYASRDLTDLEADIAGA